MLDGDLAELYNVETRVLNQSIKRNIKRFPKDFMFQLSEKEFKNLISQNVTSSLQDGPAAWGGTRKLPNAFTEQGVAMLSSILNSDVAIEVNIRIIRVFTKLREYALTHKDILLQLAKLEKEVKGNSKDIENIFLRLGWSSPVRRHGRCFSPTISQSCKTLNRITLHFQALKFQYSNS